MISKKIENSNKAIEILRNYTGQNPYLLALKRDVITYSKVERLNDFVVEYVLNSWNMSPKFINRIFPIADWYGEKKKDDWGLEETPKVIKIKHYLGETSTHYHCYIKYRREMEPVMEFLPKKGLLGNPSIEDFHGHVVDFDRYDRITSLKNPDRKLKPHQKEAIQFLLSRKKCILADDMGLGKMEPVSAFIPTPDGFKRMGNIEKGDYVFGSDGKKHKVEAVFPHKDKEIYKVTFSDGTSSECGLDHLWTVRTKNMVKRNQGWKVMSLKELIDSGLQYNDKFRLSKGLKQRNKYEIPVCEPIDYIERKYLIDPYVLGMCIGDGNLCSGTIAISIPDTEIESVERIKSLLNSEMILKGDRGTNCPRYRIVKKEKGGKNPYIQEIKRLGLNIKGNHKFIPDEYKLGSIEQRKELVRGLMDSDGSIREGNKIGFYTSSEQLADDFAEIIFSLGGIARKHSYKRIKNGEEKNEYCVFIQIKFNPFHLERKAKKYQPTFLKYCSKYIVSAEYIKNEDAKCLMVDSIDHTYLTGKSYIVTHNTTSLAVAAIEGNFDSIIIICPASIKTKWKEELLWYVPERDITIIEGFLKKNKTELEEYLGYPIGKSKKTVSELKDEARERGKWVDNRFIIVNYDIIDEFYTIPEGRSKEKIDMAMASSPMLQYIYGKKSLIIIDEAHRLSNTKSIQYGIVRDVIKRGNPDSIYLSTGTPITNNPKNFFNVLQLIGDSITDDWNYYMQRYCGAKKIPYNDAEKAKRTQITKNYCSAHFKTNWYDLTDEEKQELNSIVEKNCKMKTIDGEPSNLEELKLRTSHVYLRRLKEDIEGVVSKYCHEYFYDLKPDEKTEYDRLWDEYEAAQLEADPEKEINKELLEGGLYRQYLSKLMVPHTCALVDKCLRRGEKVVIATCYNEELFMLRDYYGDKCVIYKGGMDAKEKDAAQNKFTNDPNVNVFIGNIDAAGVGIDLVASRILIFNNISWVPGSNLQMCDRVHRLTQTRDVHIFYQFFHETQYEKMWNTVLRKLNTINAVIKKEDEK